MCNSNLNKAKQLQCKYKSWKLNALDNAGYFVIFNGFLSEKILKNLNGNALKLYIYLGLNSKNMTGEVWHTNKSIAKYFNKSERTIRNWMKELEDMNLIHRMQLEFNGIAYTYLLPYEISCKDDEFYVLRYRIKNYQCRKDTDLTDYKKAIVSGIKEIFPDAIIRITPEFFEIKLLNEPNKSELRKMGYEIKSRDHRFQMLTKKYAYIRKDGSVARSVQLFEKIL